MDDAHRWEALGATPLLGEAPDERVLEAVLEALATDDAVHAVGRERDAPAGRAAAAAISSLATNTPPLHAGTPPTTEGIRRGWRRSFRTRRAPLGEHTS